jgi:hypothetical protein
VDGVQVLTHQELEELRETEEQILGKTITPSKLQLATELHKNGLIGMETLLAVCRLDFGLALK